MWASTRLPKITYTRESWAPKNRNLNVNIFFIDAWSEMMKWNESSDIEGEDRWL